MSYAYTPAPPTAEQRLRAYRRTIGRIIDRHFKRSMAAPNADNDNELEEA